LDLKTVKQLRIVKTGDWVKKMKYVKSANEEYILDDGENINDLGKCKLEVAKKAAEEAAKKINKPVFIMKTVGYIDPDL
jgi:methionine synthase I (cobalamin-dependent)